MLELKNEFLREDIEFYNNSNSILNELASTGDNPTLDKLKEFFLNIINIVKSMIIKVLDFFNKNFNRHKMKYNSIIKKIDKNQEVLDQAIKDQSAINGKALELSIWSPFDVKEIEKLSRNVMRNDFDQQINFIRNRIAENDKKVLDTVKIVNAETLRYVVSVSYKQMDQLKKYAKTFKATVELTKSTSESAFKKDDVDTMQVDKEKVARLNQINGICRNLLMEAIKKHTYIISQVDKFVSTTI